MIVEEPDSENSLFSDPMKIRTPSARSGTAQQIDHAALGFEIVEQQPHPLQVFKRVQIFQEIGVTAHDQLPVIALAARPARDPGGNDLLRQLIEFGSAPGSMPFQVQAAPRPTCAL